ncbi:MAG: Flp family type IVb pilin [Alphaproteobacteria bacterium]
MLRTIRKLFKNEQGATAIEYGLIAALVSVAAVVALENMGGSLNSIFTTVSGKLDSAVTSAGGTGGGGTP